MIILLPTIKHTGSHFVLRQLLKDFVRIDLKGAEDFIETFGEFGDKNNGVIFDHLFPHKRSLWNKFLDKYPIIMPLRNRHEVWKSWCSRSDEPDRELFNQMWWIMEDIDKHNPFYINIDNPDIRDSQLSDINLNLKLNLDAGNWPVIRK